MTDRPTCTWTGQSGTNYTYFIYPLPASFDPGQDGNYIFSKKNGEGKWVPVYIGQGDLGNRVSDNHHQAACIKRNGATHVQLHLNANERNRTAEEADLLARYRNAYEPSGCNEQ